MLATAEDAMVPYDMGMPDAASRRRREAATRCTTIVVACIFEAPLMSPIPWSSNIRLPRRDRDTGRRIAGVMLVALAALFPAVVRADAAPALLVVGDSISAGYGLPQGAGWVALLAARLKAERYPYRVVNASITGDTTAGGRARLPGALAREKPAIVVIELGGNDGLRGGDLASTRANLDAMVGDAQRTGAKVLLVGTQLPPNYGPAYTRDYAAIFGDVARARKTALVASLFEGFGERNEMFQSDRIHPVAAAQATMLDTVWKALQPMLARPK